MFAGCSRATFGLVSYAAKQRMAQGFYGLGARFSTTSVNDNAAITLYGFKMSQPTRSVLMLLQAEKLDYEFVEVNALKGDNRKPEFKSEFPSGLVPVIKDSDGFPVEETAAILQYLCEKKALSDHWYPKDLKMRAKVNFFLHWHHANTRKATTQVLHSRMFPTELYPSLKRQKEKGEQGAKDMKRSLTFLEHILAKADYLAGGAQPSIADLLILPELDQHLPDTFAMLDFTPYKNVRSWILNMQGQTFYQGILEPVRQAAQQLSQQEAKRKS